jgi:hypothetical protein
VSSELHDWSRNILGDLAKRIKNLKHELEQCRRGVLSDSLVRREQVLRFKLERLEEQQDLMWRQRAHANWLSQGDRNTSYFHSFASERKKKNTITKLKRDDGVVVEGEEGLKALVTDYYDSLFTPVTDPSHFGDLEEHLHSIQPRVTQQMNDSLCAEFTADEVKEALDSIGDLKALGADGMPALFYKKYWHLVGEKVVQEVLHVLHGGSIPEGWNDTVVVLIPKVQHPERLKDLRPISLCNVVYKLVSKVLANRLKCILGRCFVVPLDK